MKNISALGWVGIAAAVIALLGLAYLTYKYYNCIEQEGTPCAAALSRGAFTGSPITFNPPTWAIGGKTIKCNFFTGKKCA